MLVTSFTPSPPSRRARRRWTRCWRAAKPLSTAICLIWWLEVGSEILGFAYAVAYRPRPAYRFTSRRFDLRGGGLWRAGHRLRSARRSDCPLRARILAPDGRNRRRQRQFSFDRAPSPLWLRTRRNIAISRLQARMLGRHSDLAARFGNGRAIARRARLRRANNRSQRFPSSPGRASDRLNSHADRRTTGAVAGEGKARKTQAHHRPSRRFGNGGRDLGDLERIAWGAEGFGD